MKPVRAENSPDILSTPLKLRADDQHEIYLHNWTAVKSARAILLIVHGMAEHGARYAQLGNFLNHHNIVVYAIDQRGHGQSAQTPDQIGQFTTNSNDNGWERLIADLYLVVNQLKSQHPAIPLIMLGHSMGSYISQGYAIRHGNSINGLILSGSNSSSAILFHLARALVRVEILRQGLTGKSDLLYQLSFSSFNKQFQPARTDFDWLSRDPEQVDRYINDEMCGFKLGNKSWFDLLGGLIEILQRNRLALIPANLPIYILGGDCDPVAGFGKGLPRLAAELRAAGIKAIELKLYAQGRHEMLNETNRQEVFNDIVRWLEQTGLTRSAV